MRYARAKLWAKLWAAGLALHDPLGLLQDGSMCLCAAYR